MVSFRVAALRAASTAAVAEPKAVEENLEIEGLFSWKKTILGPFDEWVKGEYLGNEVAWWRGEAVVVGNNTEVRGVDLRACWCGFEWRLCE